LKPKLEQEEAEVAESFFSVSSAISCSNPFVRFAGSRAMKPKLEQEEAEAAESYFSVSSAISSSNPFVRAVHALE
jgi:hypothetical protein